MDVGFILMMIEDFNTDVDIHAKTVAEVYNVPINKECMGASPDTADALALTFAAPVRGGSRRVVRITKNNL